MTSARRHRASRQSRARGGRACAADRRSSGLGGRQRSAVAETGIGEVTAAPAATPCLPRYTAATVRRAAGERSGRERRRRSRRRERASTLRSLVSTRRAMDSLASFARGGTAPATTRERGGLQVEENESSRRLQTATGDSHATTAVAAPRRSSRRRAPRDGRRPAANDLAAARGRSTRARGGGAVGDEPTLDDRLLRTQGQSDRRWPRAPISRRNRGARAPTRGRAFSGNKRMNAALYYNRADEPACPRRFWHRCAPRRPAYEIWPRTFTRVHTLLRPFFARCASSTTRKRRAGAEAGLHSSRRRGPACSKTDTHKALVYDTVYSTSERPLLQRDIDPSRRAYARSTQLAVRGEG